MDKDVPDHISTRIISQRQLVVDGVVFQWWAVGDRPALVTVRTKVFGSATKFTREEDVAAFANVLSKKLLAQHYARAAMAKGQVAKKGPESALKKHGWFEPGSTDYCSTTTVF